MAAKSCLSSSYLLCWAPSDIGVGEWRRQHHVVSNVSDSLCLGVTPLYWACGSDLATHTGWEAVSWQLHWKALEVKETLCLHWRWSLEVNGLESLDHTLNTKGVKQSQQIDLGGEVGLPDRGWVRLGSSSEPMGTNSAAVLTTAELGLRSRNEANIHYLH